MKKMMMRWYIGLAVITFGLCQAAHAQEKVWSVGPEVGVSVSKYGSDAGTNDLKAGAIGGMFITYSIQNTFGITTKFLYSQKGATFKSSDTRQTLNYIEIPVIGRFFLNKEGTIRPNLFVGPSFGFLTGATNKVGSEERVKIDGWQDTYNDFDFGVTGGIGVNVLIASETYFIIDGRYTHGLSDITKAPGVVNNNSLGLTVGLSFGF